MSEISLIFEAFHFLRPYWLLLLPVIALLWWLVRRGQRPGESAVAGMAPHLRQALTIGRLHRGRFAAIDGVALVLILTAFGAAGPTWSRQPDPFAAQSAPAVVVLAVTGSMQADDVAPSRLERGKQKIRDFLDLRAGARTALIAYAGSAHVVLPMTEDPQVMLPYLEGLSPEIMPKDGNVAAQAVALAQSLLDSEEGAGGILLVTDSVDPADSAALQAGEMPLAVLAVRPEGSSDRGLDGLSVPVLNVTPDGGDIRRIDGMLNAAYRRAQLENVDQPWEDRAPWLAWPAALILLLSFRRGWVSRWGAIAALAYGISAPGAARADGLADWFLTPDQQGRVAFERSDFGQAGAAFEDPLWRGYALYRDGQYDEAVQVLDRVETAQAAFIQGMAQIKSRSYRDGVRSFETALERDADYPEAAENLEKARHIVEFVETTQAQSDTGEDRGIGADDVKFDNESGQGADTQIQAEEESGPKLLSAEQWMNTVDTRTEDFLRLRFALEASQAGAPAASDEAEPEEAAQ
ncbi:MAG: VWA domain-containing protein [Mangrovicoccus sp.]|nr:VWA domain-containing protein [Mangrovicoccus sp.]